MSIEDEIEFLRSVSADGAAMRREEFERGHREGFEAGKRFAKYKIAALEDQVKGLENTLGSQQEEWETLAYRHLRDTANKEEIEYVLLGNVSPDEIDRRMKSIIKDIYPDPGFSPEAQSSPVGPPIEAGSA